jgi:hypothetical protein
MSDGSIAIHGFSVCKYFSGLNIFIDLFIADSVNPQERVRNKKIISLILHIEPSLSNGKNAK